MSAPVNGIIPVMLTPFDEEGNIDWQDLEALIEWYIAHGSTALFAVCQSSEMIFLSLEERVALARFTSKIAAGRVPVVASGHISETLDGQAEELNAISDTGVDALVLVSNRLDPERQGETVFRNSLDMLLDRINTEIPLGFYECPAPYRRLLSEDEFKACRDSGRFVVLKDVSCDLELLMARVKQSKGSPLSVVNANGAIAWEAMKAGAPGFCGIANNYHPDLYRWLMDHGSQHPALAGELSVFLSFTALTEAFGYPAFAKIYQQRLGNMKSIACRAVTGDVRSNFYALDTLVDQLLQGTQDFRARIGALQSPPLSAQSA
jgi:4-hydroxy-tetrahydrodipicolinate synthase